ncbi:MAG: Sir2 family NAD-dependent protein deacetylase [Candidatus Anammoxibacter sp.]
MDPIEQLKCFIEQSQEIVVFMGAGISTESGISDYRSQGGIRQRFQPALRMAGLRKIRFHDLRHTYTSLLIAQGENVKFIQS